jgi:hypothetical protein
VNLFVCLFVISEFVRKTFMPQTTAKIKIIVLNPQIMLLQLLGQTIQI